MLEDLSFNGQIALMHGRAGRKVFPCRDTDQVVNGETKKAKSPLGGIYWEKQATTDEKQIQSWWRQWPQALVGMPLQPAGFTVIDADCHHNGQHGIERL